jgi:hypothetical protein
LKNEDMHTGIEHEIRLRWQIDKREDLFTALATRINDLIDHDFGHLVQLLYQIDVSEKKINEVLALHADQPAGELLATLVLERMAAIARSRADNQGLRPPADDPMAW